MKTPINLSHDFVRPYGMDNALWTLIYIVGLSKREITKQASIKYLELHRPRMSPNTRSALNELLIKYSDIIEKQKIVSGSRSFIKSLRELNKARARFINHIIDEVTEIK